MDEYEVIAQYARSKTGPDFEALVRRYEPVVHAAARRQVGDPHLAADITQAALLALVSKAGKLRRGQPVGPWLLRVTHYLAIDAMRNISMRRRHERSAARQHPEVHTIGSPPWRSIEPVLDAALHQLAERDRVVLTLRYLQDWTTQQIAAELRVHPTAVRQQLSRALRRLRKVLHKRGIQREDFLPAALPWWETLRRYFRTLIRASRMKIAASICGALVFTSLLAWTTGALRKTPITTNVSTATLAKAAGLRARSTIP